jgi:hypothetical protein
VTPKERDTLARYCEARASDRGWRQRAVVEISALDQQVRKPSTRPKLTDLPPETAPLKAEVQIEHRLAFDEHSVTQVVVAHRQARHVHIDP